MKNALCCVLLIVSATTAKACDVCGASSSNQTLGLLPQMYRHFVGVQYQYSNFNSVQKPLSDNKPSINADQQYQTVQLWGRYCIGNRWQLFGFLSYRSNTYQSSSTNTATQGIGDASILVNHTFLQSADSVAARHRLQGGLGIKAPTAKYTGVTQLERMGLPNTQAGTGSWDIPLNINYTLRIGNIGVNADVAYNITLPNRDDYKYGNKLTSQLIAFYWLQKGGVSILPQVGLNNEYSLHDYDNYAKKWLNEQTGGYILSTKVGAQLYYNKFGFQAMYSIPVSQNFGAGNITAKQKIDMGIMFLF